MFSMLQYDIPNRSGVTNPSNRLRRLAIRTSLSVWIVRDDHLPHTLIHNMLAAGCTVRVLPFASQAAQQVLATCTEELKKEVERIRKSLADSLAKSGDKLADQKISPSQCMAAQRAALKRAEKALADAAAVERLFGIDAAVSSGRAALEALHVQAQERAAAYVELTRDVAEIDPALAQAATQDEVPAPVLADKIEDETGRDMSRTHQTFGTCTILGPSTREIAEAQEQAEKDFPDYKNPHEQGSLLAQVYEQAWDALNVVLVEEMSV